MEYNLPDISKNDFDLLPSKLSIAQIFDEQLRTITKHEVQTQQRLKITHEDIYEHIEESYLRIFKQPLSTRFASFESFRKFFNKYTRESYRKNAKNESILD